MALGPYSHEGATVTIVPPEASEDITTTNYDVIVELRARKYLLHLWHPAGANFIFGSIGKLYCVDQCSVTGQDFTVIRAFVLLERGKRVPPSTVLRMPNNDVVIVYFDVSADAPPPPPSPQAQTVPSMVSRGTQTDSPDTPLQPNNTDVDTHVQPPSAQQSAAGEPYAGVDTQPRDVEAVLCFIE
jgi:hypothetical protein